MQGGEREEEEDERPIEVSKETYYSVYYSVKRDLLWCLERPEARRWRSERLMRARRRGRRARAAAAVETEHDRNTKKASTNTTKGET